MTRPGWIQRFEATSIGFPVGARDNPDRCLYTSNASGKTELYGWDRATDQHFRATERADGTRGGSISPDGTWIWWFDDSGGNETGRWMRQPFAPASEVTPSTADPELPLGHAVGLKVGRSMTAIGLSTDDGTSIYRHQEGRSSQRLYFAETFAWVGSLSHDERLLAFMHTEHGDTYDSAVRVVGTDDGTIIGDLWDGPGHMLTVVGFAPGDGDGRLLLLQEREGSEMPMIWDLENGRQDRPEIDLPGELSAEWHSSGNALVLRQRHHGRDRLYRYDLDTGRITPVETEPGTIDRFAVRPSGALEYQWSNAALPHAVRDDSGRTVMQPTSPAPSSVPLTEAWIDGPGGPVHALVARPEGEGPVATVFLLHGGPGGNVADGFWPARAAFVDAGYAVIHVNYRGSSGYGALWRDANRERPGLIELEDITAVRNWAVDSGLSRADGCVLGGISWGGYLTLLGLGVQPEAWAAGLADVPIGDLVALYEDEMEPVREHDKALFGGTPWELPDKWALSNPITYADKVVAPLLVLAGRNDVRCPIRQVHNFLGRLDECSIPYESYEFEDGHIRLVIDEQIRQMECQLDFLRRHVPA